MISSFAFWIWGTIVAQLLTALAHSMSFVAPAKPRNDTEKQLIELMTKYKMDMGAGFKRSFGNLFIGVSTCFTIIFLFGAALNWYFVKTGINAGIWKGLLMIELITYGIIFVLQVRFTFFASNNCNRPDFSFFGRNLFLCPTSIVFKIKTKL
jgi:hypothetical protein